jgi:hypothetical protein
MDRKCSTHQDHKNTQKNICVLTYKNFTLWYIYIYLYGMIILRVIKQGLEMGFRSICCRLTVGTVLETVHLLHEPLLIASRFPFHYAIRIPPALRFTSSYFSLLCLLLSQDLSISRFVTKTALFLTNYQYVSFNLLSAMHTDTKLSCHTGTSP